MITDKNLDEQIKNAICQNDVTFFESHKSAIDINYVLQNEDGDTMLSYSLSDNKTDIYKYFLDNGAKLDVINLEGETLLHSAVYSGDCKRVELLINDYNQHMSINRGTNE